MKRIEKQPRNTGNKDAQTTVVTPQFPSKPCAHCGFLPEGSVVAEMHGVQFGQRIQSQGEQKEISAFFSELCNESMYPQNELQAILPKALILESAAGIYRMNAMKRQCEECVDHADDVTRAAIFFYRKAHEVTNDSQFLEQAAALHGSIGEYAKALDIYDGLMETRPTNGLVKWRAATIQEGIRDAIDAYCSNGDTLARDAAFAELRRSNDRLIKLDRLPHGPRTEAFRANAKMAACSGDHESAIDWYQKILKDSKGCVNCTVDGYASLAAEYRMIGRGSEEARAFEKAVSVLRAEALTQVKSPLRHLPGGLANKLSSQVADVDRAVRDYLARRVASACRSVEETDKSMHQSDTGEE